MGERGEISLSSNANGVFAYFPKYWPQMPIQKYKRTQILPLDSLKRLEIYNQRLLYKSKLFFANSGKQFIHDVPLFGLLRQD